MVLEKEIEEIELEDPSTEVSEENEISTNNDNDINDEHVNINQINFNENNFWSEININDLNNYLVNMQNIKSNVLQNEINNLLLIENLDYTKKKNRDVFYSIINYFYNIGNISSAYKLIILRDLDLDLDENISFYKTIELNYLLATYQLEDLCIRKEDISDDIKISNFLLEKLDIFCLILENKISEAELINSIFRA